MSKKNFLRGTFLLTSAGFISRIIGFFYRIFLSHTIGAQGIGLYQLAFPLQSLILSLTTIGIQTALSRLISARLAVRKEKEAGTFFLCRHIHCLYTFLSFFFSSFSICRFFFDKNTQGIFHCASDKNPLLLFPICIFAQLCKQLLSRTWKSRISCFHAAPGTVCTRWKLLAFLSDCSFPWYYGKCCCCCRRIALL